MMKRWRFMREEDFQTLSFGAASFNAMWTCSTIK